MTNDFEDGIARMRNDAREVFVVPEAHRAAVFQGLEQAERGEFVSEEEMARLWKKCGL
jgi:predicted transcriptional regulator